MQNDVGLLRYYAADRSEAAFTELVRRQVDLVYSTALRLANGDAHRAQDVTQQVFVELARHAPRLATHPALEGWLYTTTRRMAQRQNRTEQRRAAREHTAHTMNELLRDSVPEESWNRLRPVLDDAMQELNERDRLAVLLRFFQNKTLKEVGDALALNENAARMRVDRALEKLRLQLARKGVTSTSGALAAALAVNAVNAAPSAFAAALANSALAGATAGAGTALTSVQFLTMTKLKTGFISAIVVAGVATPLVIQHQAGTKLREREVLLQEQSEQLTQLTTENARLSRLLAQAENSLAPNLPPPPTRPIASSAAPVEDTSRDLLDRILRGEAAPKLTPEQAEAFLDENRRNASSLLAAYRTSGDPALLEEAMRNFPDDPQVAFEAAFKKDAFPEERRYWLDTFKESAPDNALANYLSALEHFKSGQVEQAIEDLNAASGKTRFEDYTIHRWHADEEAYRSAGYSEAETKMAATWGLVLPQLAELRDVAKNMVDLANSYRQDGDESSAQAALQMAIGMGQHFDGSKGTAGVPLVTQLVGIAIERNALNAMDPTGPYGDGGQTVQDRLDQLAQRRESIKEGARQVESLQPMMSAEDWITYNTRTRSFGEENAIQWLTNKYGQ